MFIFKRKGHFYLSLIFLSTLVFGLLSTLSLVKKKEKLETRGRAAASAFKYYGAKFALLENHETLGPLGANTYLLVLRPDDSEDNWRRQLDAFAAKNLKVIVWLWGGGGRVGHAVEWGNGDWDLSKTERFLAFAKKYVSEHGRETLFAFYGPHEIYNKSKWLEGVGIEQHKRLYSLLKSHPNWPEGVLIFGRIWSDYDADDSWNKEDMEKFSQGVCDICTIRYTPFRTDGSFLKEEYIANLAHDRALIQDKGQSRFVPYAPAFAFDNFRMPTSDEMREAGKLACDVKPDGVIWHVWLHGGYSGELRNHPELWPVIGEIYDYCLSKAGDVPQTTPSPTSPISPTPPTSPTVLTPSPPLISPTLSPSPSPAPLRGECRKADLNNDGAVNSLDYWILVRNYARRGDGLLGDINNDKIVNALDLSLLLTFYGPCPK